MKPALREVCRGLPMTLGLVRWRRRTSLLPTTNLQCSLLSQQCFCSTDETVRRPNPTENDKEKQPEQQSCTPPASENTLDDILVEVQAVLNRPLQIGVLFRALSATSRRTLAKNKLPLEQLLLRYPNNFVVYRQKQGRNATISCAPPHLVPEGAARMQLERPPAVAPTNSSSDVNARVLQHDPIAEKQRNIHTVLQYIPNEWSPFTELGIPDEVRVKCMGKPGIKANEYFQKYPQYFEVRQQGQSEHTFYVRRSLALQRKLEKGS